VFLPWGTAELCPRFGTDIPCFYADGDNFDDPPNALAGCPDLFAAVNAEFEVLWQDEVGLDSEVPWDALSLWMESLGWPIETELIHEQYRYIYRVRLEVE
jgi:hypothetical protein